MLHDEPIVSDTWKKKKANKYAMRFTLVMWLVGANIIVGNQVTIMADRPFAGIFDDPTPPIIDDVPYATFIFTFFDCFNGMVEYDIPSKNLTGEYAIERITPDVLCEELAAQP